MDLFDRMLELTDKVKAGKELTDAEKAEVQAFVEAMTEALQPLFVAIQEIAANLLRVFNDWWTSLPLDVRVSLMNAAQLSKQERIRMSNMGRAQMSVSSTPMSIGQANLNIREEILGQIWPGQRSQGMVQ